MEEVEQRLNDLGLSLPAAPKPVAAYVPCTRTGGLIFVSGQVPFREGELAFVGKVGAERTVEEGAEAARICTLNALAVLKGEIGSLDRVKRILQVRGYVNSTPDFGDQPEVINGASELLAKLFGDRGRHARAAVGVASLPRHSTVELEMMVEVDER